MTVANPTITMSPELSVRPMREADLTAAADVSAAAFDIDFQTADGGVRWARRVRHPLVHDPGGAFVAELDGRIVGVGQAIRREQRLWVLSLLTVDPQAQSSGAGRALLDATLTYAEPTDAGMVVSSNDPRAIRLYAMAGLAPRPTFEVRGRIDPARLPAADPAIVELALGPADLEWIDVLTRQVRGAAYGPELGFLVDRGARILAIPDRGFVIVDRQFGVMGLVAADEAAAEALLSCGLAQAPNVENRPGWITGEQQWAVRTVLAAGLRLQAYGALCVRGTPGTLQPFLPTPPFA